MRRMKITKSTRKTYVNMKEPKRTSAADGKDSNAAAKKESNEAHLKYVHDEKLGTEGS